MPSKKPTPKYGRILLKLSGEALGAGGLGIDPSVLRSNSPRNWTACWDRGRGWHGYRWRESF